MTPNNFKKYCQRNKLVKIVPTEYCIDLFFKGNKRIVVRSGIDGLIYSIWKKPKDGATKKLITDLNSLMPDMVDNLIKKYGGSGVLLAEELSKNKW